MTPGYSVKDRRPTQFSYELRALRVGRALISLTQTQADLLQVLYQRFGEIVSNEDMIKGMYGLMEPEGAYNQMRTRIYQVRVILNASGSKWEIVTTPRRGAALQGAREYAWP